MTNFWKEVLVLVFSDSALRNANIDLFGRARSFSGGAPDPPPLFSRHTPCPNRLSCVTEGLGETPETERAS